MNKEALEIAIEAWHNVYDGAEFANTDKAIRAAIAAYRDSEIEALRTQVAVLQRFKDYVHTRLDDAGIPTHPNGEHSAAGCRIGDRLDITFAKLADCQAVIRHKGHDDDCLTNKCATCGWGTTWHGRADIQLPHDCVLFIPLPCSETCGHDRTTREKA